MAVGELAKMWQDNTGWHEMDNDLKEDEPVLIWDSLKKAQSVGFLHGGYVMWVSEGLSVCTQFPENADRFRWHELPPPPSE